MLIDQNETREVLRQIVCKLSDDRASHEDLLQEAFIHLWLQETHRPGQTQSWYLQSCRFYLQNHLRTGRSVDSPKHQRSAPASVDPEADTEVGPAEGPASSS